MMGSIHLNIDRKVHVGPLIALNEEDQVLILLHPNFIRALMSF